jgi:hypothetical protein
MCAAYLPSGSTSLGCGSGSAAEWSRRPLLRFVVDDQIDAFVVWREVSLDLRDLAEGVLVVPKQARMATVAQHHVAV